MPEDQDASMTNNGMLYKLVIIAKCSLLFLFLFNTTCLNLQLDGFKVKCVEAPILNIFTAKIEYIQDINIVGVDPAPENHSSKSFCYINMSEEPNAPVL